MIKPTATLTFADQEDAICHLAEINAPHLDNLIDTKVLLLRAHARLHWDGLQNSGEHETIQHMINHNQTYIDRGYNSLWC